MATWQEQVCRLVEKPAWHHPHIAIHLVFSCGSGPIHLVDLTPVCLSCALMCFLQRSVPRQSAPIGVAASPPLLRPRSSRILTHTALPPYYLPAQQYAICLPQGCFSTSDSAVTGVVDRMDGPGEAKKQIVVIDGPENSRKCPHSVGVR